MTFMHKHINMFLIVAIGIAFLLLGAVSYYYQGTFREVISNYQTTKTSLKTCSAELGQLKEKYQKAELTANTSNLDVEKTAQLYEEKTGELDQTKGKLKTTESALSQTQNSLAETKRLYETEKLSAAKLQSELSVAINDISELRDRNNALKGQNAKLNIDLATCRGASS